MCTGLIFICVKTNWVSNKERHGKDGYSWNVFSMQDCVYLRLRKMDSCLCSDCLKLLSTLESDEGLRNRIFGSDLLHQHKYLVRLDNNRLIIKDVGV